MAAISRKTTTRTWYYRLHWSCHNNEVNGNIFITLVVYVKHMKKSKWLDCQGNEFFPKIKGDSITGQDRAQKHCDFRFSQIEKKSKVAVLQLSCPWICRSTYSTRQTRLSVSITMVPSIETPQTPPNHYRTYNARIFFKDTHGLFVGGGGHVPPGPGTGIEQENIQL